MSNLRDIVRRHVEEQVRVELQSSETFTDQQLQAVLERQRAKGNIDREVDRILDAFLQDVEKESPRRKHRRIRNLAFSAVSLVFTTLIGYGVNITDWTMVIAMIIATLIMNAVFLFLTD